MNALARIFQRDQVSAIRPSARIRDELAALPQPQRYSEMLHEAGKRRAELKTLSGQELEDASIVVAGLDADAVAYRAKHSRVFDQAEALVEELVQVQTTERQAIIRDRLEFHRTVEAVDCAKRKAELEAANAEWIAQQVATQLLAKAWKIEVPWTFGFPPASVMARANEIVAELQGA
jgi:hypothetical protein